LTQEKTLAMSKKQTIETPKYQREHFKSRGKICRQKTDNFINDDYSWILLAENFRTLG
jgi:hypothetical protein